MINMFSYIDRSRVPALFPTPMDLLQHKAVQMVSGRWSISLRRMALTW